VRFPRSALQISGLSKTYARKPLVTVDDEHLFGELAILRLLEADGWKGAWVDTFHGRGRNRVLWDGMPPAGRCDLPNHASNLYERVVAANGGRSSGFFDVFAWRQNEFKFFEYKGRGDSRNKNETRWINSALDVGILPSQLFYVVY
jgi:hypothetical protein